MSEQTAQEPTMEEILASIRRIISEDDAPAEAKAEPDAEPAPAAAAPAAFSPAMMDETPSVEEDEEVLELTQRYEEPTPFARPTPVETVGDIEAAPRAPEPQDWDEPEPVFEAPQAQAPAFTHEPAWSQEDEQEDTLVSDRTADTAASAFAGLAQSLMLPKQGRSLEDLVKELMKPMLKDWLDQNLPAIVEAQVQAEVERIARRGAR
jgi:hypothetical protein